jgi:hypothetical protein
LKAPSRIAANFAVAEMDGVRGPTGTGTSRDKNSVLIVANRQSLQLDRVATGVEDAGVEITDPHVSDKAKVRIKDVDSICAGGSGSNKLTTSFAVDPPSGRVAI